MNTQFVTEKTMRAAHDKQLAEEIDKLRKTQAQAEGSGAALQKADIEAQEGNRKLIEETKGEIATVLETLK